MKRILNIVLSIIMPTTNVIFTGCGGGSGSDSDASAQATNIVVVVVTDPNTDLALVAGTTTEYLAVFGAKNSNGYLSGKASAVVYVKPDCSWVQMTLGSDGNPASLTMSDGSSVQYSNYTGSVVLATFYDVSSNKLGCMTVETSGLLAANKDQLNNATGIGNMYRQAVLAFNWVVGIAVTVGGLYTGIPLLVSLGTSAIFVATVSTVLDVVPSSVIPNYVRQAWNETTMFGNMFLRNNFVGIALQVPPLIIDWANNTSANSSGEGNNEDSDNATGTGQTSDNGNGVNQNASGDGTSTNQSSGNGTENGQDHSDLSGYYLGTMTLTLMVSTPNSSTTKTGPMWFLVDHNGRIVNSPIINRDIVQNGSDFSYTWNYSGSISGVYVSYVERMQGTIGNGVINGSLNVDETGTSGSVTVTMTARGCFTAKKVSEFEDFSVSDVPTVNMPSMSRY